MATGQLQIIASCGAVSVNSTITKTGSGAASLDLPTPEPAATVGQVTTRTNTTDGVITLAGGHPIITGKVDVYWVVGTPGMRYGVDATIATNACTITGGAGANLPDNLSAVQVSQQDQLDIGFDGDNMEMFIAYAPAIASMDFQDSSGNSLFHQQFTAGQAVTWYKNSGVATPITGAPVAKVKVSNGDTTQTNALKVLVLYDA